MDKMINYFENEFNLSKIEKAKLKYSTDVLFNDISKLLLLLALFVSLDKTKEFLYSVIGLLTIRPFTGGLHFNKYKNCLIFSCLFFLISIILNVNISLDNLIPIFFLISFITILILAPIINKDRPTYSYKKQLYFKFVALVIIIVHFIGYILLRGNIYFTSSIWVFTLQSFQLIIKKGLDTYEKT